MFRRNLLQEFDQSEQESIDQLTEERAYYAGQWVTLMRNPEGQLVKFRIGHKRYEANNLTLEQAITDFNNFKKHRMSFFESSLGHDLTTSQEQRFERKTFEVKK